MVDRDIALEVLCTLCNANVTSIQRQNLQAHTRRLDASVGACMSIKTFIPTVLDADETSQVSRSTFDHVKAVLQSGVLGGFGGVRLLDASVDTRASIIHTIDEDEFFDKRFDYDFSNLRDTETYYRGGELYERPSGWYRFALRVLDKYESEKWLGTHYRSTESVPGEWPVSYHGTSKKGAEGIIEGYYKPGPGQVYGRGVYSTPYIAEAEVYVKSFSSKKNGKTYKVIMQNRINPEHRQKHNNDKYWLVPIPACMSDTAEQELVQQAIRPYGLLLKEV